MAHGFFITVEGGEGAGKSTMLAFMRDWLTRAGHDVVVTREPGGTELGERVREVLLHARDLQISAGAEALLMFAARAEQKRGPGQGGKPAHQRRSDHALVSGNVNFHAEINPKS